MSLSNIAQAADALVQTAVTVFAAIGEMAFNNRRAYVFAKVKA